MPRPCFYLDSTEERDLLLAWHSGQGSLFYAVGSTGALELGTEDCRAGRTDLAWFHDLLINFCDELDFILARGDVDEASLAAEIRDRVMEYL